MERVLVTGVSGPIGTALLPSLEARNAHIVRLVRGPARNADQISWNPLAPLAPESVAGFETVIHLAGESIAGRWTDAKKKAVRESRVLYTRHLASALSHAPSPPRVFLCASAIGFYGDRGDELLTEESSSGVGFLAALSREWEAASREATESGIRTVNLRFGLVLSPKGGALAKMLTPFRLGLGGRFGSGRQWWSWIHVDDIVGAIHHAIGTASLSGPLNLAAPSPVTNREFTDALAAVLRRPALFPVPAFAARLAFGEMAQELLLASQRVRPVKLEDTGYSFHFRDLRPALEDLLD